MPTDASPIGALDLPLAAGAANERIADPVLDGLLDYFAYWLNDGLNARLAQHAGVKRGAALCTAVPAAQRFPWNPMDSQAEKFRLDPPCLFLWWADESALAVKEEQSTIIYSLETRILRLLWLFPEMPSTDQYILRTSVLSAADALLHQSSVRQRHRLYSYGGRPAGTPIAECIAAPGMLEWNYVGGKMSRWGLNDQDPSSSGINFDCKRDWPCLIGVVRVREKVADATMLDPQDVTGDLAFTLDGAVESDETIPMMERYLDSPDGSELEGEDRGVNE